MQTIMEWIYIALFQPLEALYIVKEGELNSHMAKRSSGGFRARHTALFDPTD